MSEEWGPWIEHEGLNAPNLAIGLWIQVRGSHDSIEFQVTEGTKRWKGWFRVNDWTQNKLGNLDTARRYRIRKPRGLTILEGLLEELPEGVDA